MEASDLKSRPRRAGEVGVLDGKSRHETRAIRLPRLQPVDHRADDTEEASMACLDRTDRRKSRGQRNGHGAGLILFDISSTTVKLGSRCPCCDGEVELQHQATLFCRYHQLSPTVILLLFYLPFSSSSSSSSSSLLLSCGVCKFGSQAKSQASQNHFLVSGRKEREKKTKQTSSRLSFFPSKNFFFTFQPSRPSACPPTLALKETAD